MDAEMPVVFCGVCLDWKPLDQFRRRHKGSERRHYECRDCANAYMREWRKQQRRKKFDDAIAQLHRYRESPGQLEYLAAVVLAAFNGAAGFAAEYGRALDAALAAGDHRAVQRYVFGLMDFAYVAERAKTRRDLENEKRRRRREAARRAAMRDQDW